MTLDLFEPATPGRHTRLGEHAALLHGWALPRIDALWPALQAVLATAPPRQMRTPGGRAMSAQLSSCGALGWVSDEHGYRYSPTDPLTGQPWPGSPGWAERTMEHPALDRLSSRMRRAVFPERLMFCGGPVLMPTARTLAAARRSAEADRRTGACA